MCQLPQGDGVKKAWSPGRARSKPLKPLRRESRTASAEPVCSCALCHAHLGTRDRGCSAHPAFPALFFFGGRCSCKPRAHARERRSYVQLSSLRTQGPIRRVLSLWQWSGRLLIQPTPGVMGPCVRRDDTLGGAAVISALAATAPTRRLEAFHISIYRPISRSYRSACRVRSAALAILRQLGQTLVLHCNKTDKMAPAKGAMAFAAASLYWCRRQGSGLRRKRASQ